MKSLWSENTSLPAFPALKDREKTDVLIIGGGIAGLLCAKLLTECGVSCTVVEKDTICRGVTAGTSAKITAAQGVIYSKILQSQSEDIAEMYYGANIAAAKKYEALCREIDCDYEKKDNYVYSLDDRASILREIDAIEKVGGTAEFCDQVGLPFSVAGALRVRDQAQFDPLKFLSAIAKDLKIYEHTEVIEVRNGMAICREGHIRADAIIVATHFPFINKHGSYFLKMYQHRSYVVALEGADPVDGMYISDKSDGLSFRMAGDLLLLGGGGHRTGKRGGGIEAVRNFAARTYPAAHEKYAWATQDCITLDGLPYVGPYSKRTKGLYVITGFNKWGMTGAMSGAMILCDLLTGRGSDYAPAFDPSRSIWKRQLLINGIETTKNMLTPTTPRCPHLGCALKYNRAEHSWDCPCHGSRFASNGELLDGPATGDLDCKATREKKDE